MDFRTFIIEERTNTHLEHAEDDVFNGHDGARRALDTIKSVAARVQGKPSNAKVYTKFDGSPGLVFGHHQGKFFVGTKAAFSNNPKLLTSHSEIDRHYKDKLADTLHTALDHLPKVTPSQGIYQGEMMYNRPDVHEDNSHYHFTPNTIMYSVPKTSPEGHKIRQSQMGIVIHSKFHGPDLQHLKPMHLASLGDFKQHKDVNVISDELPVNKPLRDEETLNKVNKHLFDAERELDAAPAFAHADTVGSAAHLKQYVQHTAQQGSKPTAQGFKAFLADKSQRATAELKTPSGKARRRELLLTHLNHIDNHHDAYHSLLTAHHHLAQAKLALLGPMAENGGDWETSINGKPVKPEGYVVNLHGHQSKLVDRAEFSQANASKHLREDVLTEGGNETIDGVKAERIGAHHAPHIHGALQHLHQSFKADTGHDLFGPGAKALHSGSAYSGSTKHLMSGERKSSIGDVDVMVPHEHAEALHKHLTPGRQVGHYTVVGAKRRGTETTALMKTPRGQVHQFDFEHVAYHGGEPHPGDQFLHSSSAEDAELGIKGAHHKMLLNAAGGTHYKYHPQRGIVSRTDEKDATKNPVEMTHRLFGPKADPSHIHSFSGVSHLIAHHVPDKQHRAILDKFADSTARMKHVDSSHAIRHLRKALGVAPG